MSNGNGPTARARRLIEEHARTYGPIPETHRLIEEIGTELGFIQLAATPHYENVARALYQHDRKECSWDSCDGDANPPDGYMPPWASAETELKETYLDKARAALGHEAENQRSGAETEAKSQTLASPPPVASEEVVKRAAHIAEQWTNIGYMKLHAGEMSAQEVRSVTAVARAIAAEIRRTLSAANLVAPGGVDLEIKPSSKSGDHGSSDAKPGEIK